jgi:translation initiation factor 4G
VEAEIRYKTRMLGNIRFVGALLARHMLAGKVLVAILEELITDPSPEALETTAALLTVTGPVFDTPEWAHIEDLEEIFAEVKVISQSKSTSQRVKCLLQDVLDLRAAELGQVRSFIR